MLLSSWHAMPLGRACMLMGSSLQNRLLVNVVAAAFTSLVQVISLTEHIHVALISSGMERLRCIQCQGADEFCLDHTPYYMHYCTTALLQ